MNETDAMIARGDSPTDAGPQCAADEPSASDRAHFAVAELEHQLAQAHASTAAARHRERTALEQRDAAQAELYRRDQAKWPS